MNTKIFLYGLIGVLVISLILGYIIFVLTAWSLEGKVIDYNGEPVPHATVTFTSYTERFKVTTDEKGHYAIHNNILVSMPEGRYRVIATRKIGKDEFVGYEGDYEVKKKDTIFNIHFKNKDALDTHRRVLGVMKRKFDDLRPTPPPDEPKPPKMEYEVKAEPIKDIVDLKDLGDYYIELWEEGNIVYIDLKYGDKVIERGDIILNCSLFKGWTRPEGHRKELLNNIGLDEVGNTLTKDDGVIKIWTKHTWPEAGDRYSDVIISPLNVYYQRIGKSESFSGFVDGFVDRFTAARPKPPEKGEEPGPPPRPIAVEVDLSGLMEYTIHIKRKEKDRVCINLMKGDEAVERSVCIRDTNMWKTEGRNIYETARPAGMFPELKNTIGVVGVGRFIDRNTIELSKDDGIVYILNDETTKDCVDPTIVAKSVFDKYYVVISREHRDDKEIIHFKKRGE